MNTNLLFMYKSVVLVHLLYPDPGEWIKTHTHCVLQFRTVEEMGQQTTSTSCTIT